MYIRIGKHCAELFAETSAYSILRLVRDEYIPYPEFSAGFTDKQQSCPVAYAFPAVFFRKSEPYMTACLPQVVVIDLPINS